MMVKNTKLFSLFLLFLFSCGQQPFKDKPNHPNWTILNLPNNWTLEAPSNFKDSSATGIDSQPGYIYSTTDSIFLDFDSGRELFHKADCDIQRQIQKEKRSTLLDLFNERSGFKHTLTIDTIEKRIASIITPIIVGNGITHISIQDCSTGEWLAISGNNLTKQQQKIVLGIFKTIRNQR